MPARVERVERKDPYKIVHLADGSALTAKARVVTSGVEDRRLTADGLDEFTGLGVYYGTSNIEAQTHKDQPMIIVGGGNSAGQAALFLTRFIDAVMIVIRRDDLAETMSASLVDNIAANDRITVHDRQHVTRVEGETHLRTVTLTHGDTGVETVIEAGALFIFVGQGAHTDWLGSFVQLDDRGFVLSGSDLGSLDGWNVGREPLPLETSVPGVFVAGDVRHNSIRRVAGAAGEGAIAIRQVHQHLSSL